MRKLPEDWGVFVIMGIYTFLFITWLINDVNKRMKQKNTNQADTLLIIDNITDSTSIVAWIELKSVYSRLFLQYSNRIDSLEKRLDDLENNTVRIQEDSVEVAFYVYGDTGRMVYEKRQQIIPYKK